LAALSGDFAALYSGMGRPSVPPEKLLRAMLLQAFYSVRSERQLMERIEFDLLFRWFVGVGIDDPVWDHSSFTIPCMPEWSAPLSREFRYPGTIQNDLP
jgi:transposase